jgi:divalent metal cation (Fe/Co/Zn/Cd) transporter
VYPPKNQAEWSGLGALLCIVVSVGAFAESISKDPLGIKWGNCPDGSLFFIFRNRALATEFCRINGTELSTDTHDFVAGSLGVVSFVLLILSLPQFVNAFASFFAKRDSVFTTPPAINMKSLITALLLMVSSASVFAVARRLRPSRNGTELSTDKHDFVAGSLFVLRFGLLVFSLAQFVNAFASFFAKRDSVFDTPPAINMKSLITALLLMVSSAYVFGVARRLRPSRSRKATAHPSAGDDSSTRAPGAGDTG